MNRYETHSERDTLAFAGELAHKLCAGASVLLYGDLGAGKSVFARGIAHALGVKGAMPSPTFTLLIPYEGDIKLYHFDLYRLNEPEEFYAAGLHEFIGGDGVALIEWPQMADIDPQPSLHVHISRTDAQDVRSISLESHGVPYDEERLARWRVDA